jgi:hypothetical protein
VLDDVIDPAEQADPSLRRPLRAGGFGCQQCLGVWRLSRVNPASWGEVVSYLSGGLLYGREVPAPKWFTPDRRRPFKPRLRAPSSRQSETEALLLDTYSYRDIATALGITYSAAAQRARKVYRNHGVRNLKKLLLKLKPDAAAIRAT